MNQMLPPGGHGTMSPLRWTKADEATIAAEIQVSKRPGLTMGEFRELTADIPDDWPVKWVMRTGENDFTHHPADASVDQANRCVEIIHD
jgi:hypothetical protein